MGYRMKTVGGRDARLDAVEAALVQIQHLVWEQLDDRGQPLRRQAVVRGEAVRDATPECRTGPLTAARPRTLALGAEGGTASDGWVVRHARREVRLTFAPASGACRLGEAEEWYRDLARAGVAVRSLYPRDAASPSELDAHMARARATGAQCRMVPVGMAFAAVVDREAVYLAPSRGREQVFRTPAAAEVLIEVFDHLWRSARHAGSEGAASDVRHGLSAQQVCALQLMSSGMKDDKIARMMNISPRTLSRLVAGAMDLLGAASRFEAGVKAQGMGLLD
ncbi:LuxR C-terminal-related transcriptional regulator [Streptomyces sp. NPDC001661]